MPQRDPELRARILAIASTIRTRYAHLDELSRSELATRLEEIATDIDAPTHAGVIYPLTELMGVARRLNRPVGALSERIELRDRMNALIQQIILTQSVATAPAPPREVPPAVEAPRRYSEAELIAAKAASYAQGRAESRAEERAYAAQMLPATIDSAVEARLANPTWRRDFVNAYRWEGMAGHPRYYALIQEAADTHARKNQDYASAADPLLNLRRCEEFGVPASLGAMVRLSDKYSRVVGLIGRGGDGAAQVLDETINDTLIDMANYALLTVVLREEEQRALSTSNPADQRAYDAEDYDDMPLADADRHLPADEFVDLDDEDFYDGGYEPEDDGVA